MGGIRGNLSWLRTLLGSDPKFYFQMKITFVFNFESLEESQNQSCLKGSCVKFPLCVVHVNEVQSRYSQQGIVGEWFVNVFSSAGRLFGKANCKTWWLAPVHSAKTTGS